MKKVALILVVLLVLALPFVFFNKGNDLLEEKGYNVEVTEKIEVFSVNEKYASNGFDSVEVIRSN